MLAGSKKSEGGGCFYQRFTDAADLQRRV